MNSGALWEKQNKYIYILSLGAFFPRDTTKTQI